MSVHMDAQWVEGGVGPPHSECDVEWDQHWIADNDVVHRRLQFGSRFRLESGYDARLFNLFVAC